VTPAPSTATEEQDCSLAADFYRERGFRPIPVKTKQPLVEWGAYQHRPPTREEVIGWYPLFRFGVGLVTAGGLAVVDVDTERPRFASTVARLHSTNAPVSETPSGGRHFYFRASETLRGVYADEWELKALGNLVVAPPTLGYLWISFPDGELPPLPEWLAGSCRHRLSLTEEVEAYCALLPGLAFSDDTGRARAQCPLHDDQRASLSVFPGRDDGRLLWRCHGCKTGGTFDRLRWLMAGKQDHGVFAGSWEHLSEELPRQPVSEATRRVLAAILDIGRERRLDPTRDIHTPYRTLAAKSGVETVQQSNGHPYLSHNGTLIRRALTEAKERGLLAVWVAPHRVIKSPTTHVRVLPDGWRLHM